jgi:nucleoid-associated protein YgaU
MNRPQGFRQRLRGLGATVLLFLLVVGFPTALIAIGAAPWNADLGKLRTLLTSPDDGTLALVVFAVVAWVTWAVMAVSVVVEAAAQLRGLSAPSIPGFALPQRAAGQLVVVAALLFVAAPAVVSGFPAPPAHAAAAPPVLAAPRLEVIAPAAPVPPPASAPVPPAAAVKREHATVDYTVKRGDSLWKIAERLLGDGARYKDIVELNRDVLNGRPDFIVSGTVLKVPHEVAPPDEGGRTSEEYVVRTGDTLSEIARDELGDPMRYPEIVAASRSSVQPDGAHLLDPDLIRPGWELTIPGTAPVEHEPVEPPDVVEPPLEVDPPDEPPVEQPTREETPGPTTEPTPSVDSTATATADGADDVEDEPSPGWLVPGLTGAGAVLAGAVLLSVRAHRRTQLRYRRPGQTIAPPPPELVRVEKTAFVSGAPLTDGIEQLDRVLRHLAATVEAEARALPVLAGVTLARGTVTLQLGEAAELPSPWEGEGSEWATPLGDAVPDVDQIPPYPMLVTVGQDDTGRLHLLNLEHLRALTLTGVPGAATALARHIAAELALNPWSLLVQIDAVGVGEELAKLDSMRLRHHAPDSPVVEQVVADLRKMEQAGLEEPDPFRVVITTSVDDATRLIDILRPARSRLGVAVISLDTAPVPGSVAVDLTKDGRLRVTDLGLDLMAAGLTSDEAAACAAIVDLTRESPAVSMPTFTRAAYGWRSLTDQAGALREELTDVREYGTVGDGSLLPNPTEDYTDVAATVTADVEALAPVVPEQVRRTVEDTDPMLDDDVAAWFSEECPLPRLALLGPVTASVHGTIVPVIAKRKPYFVELLAYLTLHPEGKTGNAVADAFSIGSSRARTDLGHLREWLGTNPRTGRLHLPLAAASRTYEQTGVKTYQLEDVLVDVDLFRRLRARGEARGADGIEDLTTALRLVEGLPFDYLRERGWSWLLDGDRLHETIGCSIVDTAHIVVLDALAKGDLATARNAAETACRAAPYDDICRLDLVKVAATEGHDDAADQMLTDDVFNRTDDHLPPIDLPERTGEVVRKQGWSTARRTGSH